MKKSLVIVSLSLLWIGCQKEGNKSVIKMDSTETAVVDNNGVIDSTTVSSSSVEVDGKKTEKTNFVYKATDGSLVKVVFNNTPEENTVAITSNKKTIVLTKDQVSGEETTYKKDDITAKVKGDSIIIDQGNNIIELKRTKI
ncbi:hypothetical protein [Chryseobacterium sp. CT-SW4]|uniref:hypothetical protein n=1 Tax=Chryseobacterium sp. SW-1 TaxID=3157343 RepID=UPI003B02662E